MDTVESTPNPKNGQKPSSNGSEPVTLAERPSIKGKFLFVGDRKLWVRGATYGTFRPDTRGFQYPNPATVEHDFAAMAAAEINAIRVYTVPPRWLLDTAACSGIRVMIGLSWEDHLAFLEDRQTWRSIEQQVKNGVKMCASHPAVLCYAVGNEIPGSIVRWYGRRKMERCLERLYNLAKATDPGALVTYVNYPTTEYLELPFLDLITFNVFLEDRENLKRYLGRIQNIAGDSPLLLTEIGLDSRRNGEEVQAEVLDWQIRTAFETGCCGAFAFAWTDEWYRGGHEIKDWDFGLTTRDRQSKPALASVRRAFAESPFTGIRDWPRISVVVCTYNGAKTIRETLEGLRSVDYPDYEVIVVNDGSTDDTEAIVRAYSVRLITTENRGLSCARNTGLEAATGEIVAYIDDDAYPDSHWLRYLALTFIRTNHAGVGGPNLPPPGDGPVAECVANAPGGPTHVLLSDDVAEHIPGCNMAFRTNALKAIGGFDPQFTATGDDVDICWRLQDQGWTLGFSPAAINWHHRRSSFRAYWKQQQGYGRGEALLERKWPARHSAAGHLSWAGRIYSKGLTRPVVGQRARVHYGTWGCAPFQSLYAVASGFWSSLSLMPEWYLVIVLLAGLSALGAAWAPMLIFLPLLIASLVLPLVQAILSARRATFSSAPNAAAMFRLRVVVACLHLLQPLARLTGRLQLGLTPWRRRGSMATVIPRPRRLAMWDENWRAPVDRLAGLETCLKQLGSACVRGGVYDRWDIEVRGGLFGSMRGLMAVEEHGAGCQLVRMRLWPKIPVPALGLSAASAFLTAMAALDWAWTAAAVLGLATSWIAAMAYADCATATGFWDSALAGKGAGSDKSSNHGVLLRHPKSNEHMSERRATPLPTETGGKI